MHEEINEIVLAAGRAAASGDWDESSRLCQRAVELDPDNAAALCGLGIYALHRGDNEKAIELLTAAHTSAPNDILILLKLAAAFREVGNPAAEREVLDAALTVDPLFVPALLQKAAWMERHGRPAAALNVYKGALQLSPAEQYWPDDFLEPLAHAQDFVKRYSARLFKHLHENLDDAVRELPPPLAARWREALAIRAGVSDPFLSAASKIQIPRLPAVPFYERTCFPYLHELEQKAELIRAELATLIAEHYGQFEPIAQTQPGEATSLTSDPDRTAGWNAYYLYRNGEPVDKNLEICPATAHAIRELPLAEIDGVSPQVYFSLLQPRTRVPARNGDCNARLIAHLPLLVPENCFLKVGFEEQAWKVGEILIFDDSLTHEYVNDSDDLCVVLAFDLWNPLLTSAERELTSKLAEATREFSA